MRPAGGGSARSSVYFHTESACAAQSPKSNEFFDCVASSETSCMTVSFAGPLPEEDFKAFVRAEIVGRDALGVE